MKYPPLPAKVMAPGGWVATVLEANLAEGEQKLWGKWDEALRRITVEKTVSREHQWRTWYHEWAHAALSDSGQDELMDQKQVEGLCEAFAIARMRERFG